MQLTEKILKEARDQVPDDVYREKARQFLIDVRAPAFRVHDDDLIEPIAALIRRAEEGGGNG